MTGRFIVFEGIDGSGKSSVCEEVGKILAEDGRDVAVTAEPTTDAIGTLIRKGIEGISPETEALLFVADRSHHTQQIRKWMDDGTTVLCDRYYASTLAYQSAPLDGRSVDMDWLITLNERITIRPDLTFLMDVSPETGLERVKGRGELSRFEKVGYLRQVRDNYLEIAKRDGFIVLNAERPIEDTVGDVLRMIREKEDRDAPR